LWSDVCGSENANTSMKRSGFEFMVSGGSWRPVGWWGAVQAGNPRPKWLPKCLGANA
jgi:hypothetical protein